MAAGVVVELELWLRGSGRESSHLLGGHNGNGVFGRDGDVVWAQLLLPLHGSAELGDG